PLMYFDGGFVARRICLNRGRGSAPRKTAVQTQHKKTFRRSTSRRKKMSEATFEQASLQLKLYDLRREPKLREAREWFSDHFHPQNLDDVMKICPPGTRENAYMRQVLTYWELVASMSNRGLVNEDLLFENGGEEWAV